MVIRKTYRTIPISIEHVSRRAAVAETRAARDPTDRFKHPEHSSSLMCTRRSHPPLHAVPLSGVFNKCQIYHRTQLTAPRPEGVGLLTNVYSIGTLDAHHTLPSTY